MQRRFLAGLCLGALSVCPLWGGCATQEDSATEHSGDAMGAAAGSGGAAVAGGSSAGGGKAGSAGASPTVSGAGMSGGGMTATGGSAGATSTGGQSGSVGAGGEAPSGGEGGAGGADSGCKQAADCDDSNPCTTDACLLGTCSYTASTTACADDKDPCTADVCAAGVCTHLDNKICACKVDKDCDDKNVCTDEHCTANQCSHTNNTVACPDEGMACTTDVCAAGACTHKDNGTCGPTGFTVDNFNSGADWLANKTTPDGRAITSAGADLLNLEGNTDLYVAASVASTVEFVLAPMTGLKKVRVVIRSAVADTGAMVKVGLWNGTAWSDKPLGTYAAIPTANYATIEVPTADFGQQLMNVTKLRLSFAPTGGQKTWQVDEISVAP